MHTLTAQTFLSSYLLKTYVITAYIFLFWVWMRVIYVVELYLKVFLFYFTHTLKKTHYKTP